MNRFRFSILTLNLWNTEHWKRRELTVNALLKKFDPDICCFQELRPETVAVIDQWLDTHQRIHDPFCGWENEGNFYFRNDMFSLKEYGALDLSMPEKNRRLFWIRLKVSGTDKTMFVSTVHLTHQGNGDEIQTGYSYRHKEALTMAENLPLLQNGEEPGIVCGDFNDPFHPSRILAEVGYSEIFNALGLLSPVTFPSQPVTDEIQMTEAIDRIMAKGPLKPILAAVPRFYANGTSASDHWPVMAVYELL